MLPTLSKITNSYTLKLMLILTLTYAVVAPSRPAWANYPNDAQELQVMARHLWAPIELQAFGYVAPQIDPNVADERLRQACVFLEAAVQLQPDNAEAWRELQSLYMSDAVDDPGRATDAVIRFTDLKPQQNEAIDAYSRYRVNRLNDRESREYYLLQSTGTMRNYPAVFSDAMVQLGILSLEKADIEAARTAFKQAYESYSYNDDALARLLELPMPVPDATDEADLNTGQLSIEQQYQLYETLRWRLRLRNNPYDLAATINLIELLDRLGSHALAQDYYQHAFDLLALDDENQAVYAELRLKQLLSAYSAKQYYSCINIAEQALQEDPDDLLVNALLGKTMQKLGMNTEAQGILTQAAAGAIAKLPTSSDPNQLQAELAWFYCFIDPNPHRALLYAQNAAHGNPLDPRSQSTLAYALGLNEKWTEAQAAVDNADPNDLITVLAQANIQIAHDDPPAALKTLQDIHDTPMGILAEQIKELSDKLEAQLDATAEAPLSQAVLPEAANERPDMFSLIFQNQFDNKDLSVIHAPEKVVQCYITLDNFANYGDAITAQLYLANIGETDLILGPGSFLDPHFLITAQIAPTSDAAGPDAAQPENQESTAPSIILAHRYLIQKRALAPGRTNISTEVLNIGPLREIIQKHPQQAYRITFRGILDPVSDGAGGFVGRMPQIQPPPVTVVRKAFTPSRVRMQSQIRFIKAGSPDERIKAAFLLGALLREDQLAQSGQLSYRPRPVDVDTIRGLIAENLTHEDFRVRAWSAYAFRTLPLSASSGEAEKLAELLSDTSWLVRLMAFHALEPVAEMTQYLRWTAAVDQEPVVQRQAQMLLETPWEIIDMPVVPVEPNELPPS